jgi:hypothetical protein
MKKLLAACFLCVGSFVSADSLDVIFRYYSAEGRLLNTQLVVSVVDGQATQTGKTDAGGWQQWRLGYQGEMLTVRVMNGSKTQNMEIHIHPDWKKTLKTLVINRVQETDLRWVLKVNHLTCRWTAGIAYPVEYQFNNPLDGQELKLKSWSCAKNQDSLVARILVISDSVMLFQCGKTDVLLAKYYLGSDGRLYRSFTNFDCRTFNSTAEKELYSLLKDETKELYYTWEGSQLILSDAAFCNWGFEF